MVNGFFGMALHAKKKEEAAKTVLEAINSANAQSDFSFYENFNTKNATPNGVPYCAWSAASAVFLHQIVHNNFKLLI
jgi:hypothetical protein